MSFRQYITDKDQEVLRFIEEYGSITIEQTQKMYYNTQKYGYDIARRRLKKLVGYDKIKVARDNYGNENVYYMDKKLPYHDLLVLSYYAELINLGTKKIYFKTKRRWLDGALISDAYHIYSLGNKMFFDIVEVVRTHGIDKEKYDRLYNSREPQKFNDFTFNTLYGGDNNLNIFPRIIVIDNVVHNKSYKINDNIDIYQLDFKFTDIAKILV